MKQLTAEQQKLVEDNLKLVYSVIHKCYPTYSCDEDLAQCGMLGLCRAAMNWDSTKSTFGTYAFQCIKNAIGKEFRIRNKHNQCVSLDTPIAEDLTIGDMIADNEEVMTDYGFLKELTADEKLVFGLRAKGYTVEDIMACTYFNRRKVLRNMRTARAKYHRYN